MARARSDTNNGGWPSRRRGGRRLEAGVRALGGVVLAGLWGCTTADAGPQADVAPAADTPTPTLAAAPAPTPVRRGTDYDAPGGLGAKAREALAASRKPVVEELFRAAGVPFPPRSLLFRAVKREAELEVWAAGDGPLAPVATYEICAASGELGPKRREGDFQVPEGFYTLDLFNPLSAYHLSMRVSYPNASDDVLSDPRHPGGAIMIHGSCASIGCLAMTDERIEELWVMAAAMRAQKRTTYVHILPARDLAALLAEGPASEHRPFWENLAEGDRIVREERRIPTVTVDAAGRYRFR